MTTLTDDILTIISTYWPNDGWITRGEIAQALDRPKRALFPEDEHALTELIRKNKIGIRTGSQDDSNERYRYKAR